MYRNNQSLHIQEDAWMNSSYEHLLPELLCLYSLNNRQESYKRFLYSTNINCPINPTITSTSTDLLRRATYPNCRRLQLLHNRQIENVEVL